MGAQIPVVTIPERGNILGRPRKEGVYDTEFWAGGSAIAAKITLFRDSTRFASPGTADLTKVSPRDTNMDSATGLSVGQHLHWYYTKNKIRCLAANKFSATYITNLDEIRRIRESTWFSFYFGGTGKGHLFTVQLWQIGEGCGVPQPYSTYNALTIVSSSQGELDRENIFDVSMNGVPVEIGQKETFTADIESNGVTPTPTTNDVYNTTILGGYFLRGIQG